MQINMVGWRWKHPDNFQIIRPDGVHGMQLVLVQSKARVQIGDTEYKVGKNTVFIMSSCVPHSLFADGEEYADDWIRYSIEEEDRDFLKGLEIKYNVPIKLNSDAVSDLIRLCDITHKSENSEKDEILRHLLMSVLLYINDCCKSVGPAGKTRYDAELDMLRQNIYDSPAEDWTIPKMAKMMNLSEVHFQRIYKSRFCVSCTKDIITARMELAKQLLKQTDMPAGEIAEKCGYPSYSHFSKAFSGYACVSPAKYRKL